MKKLVFCLLGLSSLQIAAESLQSLANSLEQIRQQAVRDKLYKKRFKKFEDRYSKQPLEYLDKFIDLGFDKFFEEQDASIQGSMNFPGITKEVIAHKAGVKVDKLNSDLTVLAFFLWKNYDFVAELNKSSGGKLFLKALVKKPKVLKVILECDDCVKALQSGDVDESMLGVQANAIESGDWDNVDGFTIDQKINDLKFDFGN